MTPDMSFYVSAGIDKHKCQADAEVRARNGEVVVVHDHRKGGECQGSCYIYEGSTAKPYEEGT
jgi:hypothetical protein